MNASAVYTRSKEDMHLAKFVMHGSPLVLLAAAGNAAVAVAKFVAAAITGSSAMIAEGVHSLVDTCNCLLLIYGTKQSQSAPDAGHPFGHGKELYFWALIVAVVVFAIGGGMSVYGGIQRILHPVPLTHMSWNYAVLAFAAVAESAAWLVAYREVRRTMGSHSHWRAFRSSKDPTAFTVLIQDSASLIALAVAAAGIYLTDAFGVAEIDGAATVLIGLILAAVGLFLAYESKELLIGEGVDPVTLGSIRTMTQADPAVLRLGRVLTMHFGPADVLLTMEVEFRPVFSAAEVASAIERLDRAIRTRYPEIRLIFLESQSMAALARTAPAAVNTDGAIAA